MIGNHNSKNKLMHGVGVYVKGRLDSKTPEYKLWCSVVRMGADAIHPKFVHFQEFGAWLLSHHIRWTYKGLPVAIRLCNVFCEDGKPGPDSIPMPKELATLLNNPNSTQARIMPVLKEYQNLFDEMTYEKIHGHAETRRKGRPPINKPAKPRLVKPTQELTEADRNKLLELSAQMKPKHPNVVPDRLLVFREANMLLMRYPIETQRYYWDRFERGTLR